VAGNARRPVGRHQEGHRPSVTIPRGEPHRRAGTTTRSAPLRTIACEVATTAAVAPWSGPAGAPTPRSGGERAPAPCATSPPGGIARCAKQATALCAGPTGPCTTPSAAAGVTAPPRRPDCRRKGTGRSQRTACPRRSPKASAASAARSPLGGGYPGRGWRRQRPWTASRDAGVGPTTLVRQPRAETRLVKAAALPGGPAG
jgi:hypothetical protein